MDLKGGEIRRRSANNIKEFIKIYGRGIIFLAEMNRTVNITVFRTNVLRVRVRNHIITSDDVVIEMHNIIMWVCVWMLRCAHASHRTLCVM